MASRWDILSVAEMAEVVGGGTPKTDIPRYWNGTIPWLTPKDLANHHGRYVERGERMLSEEGLGNSSAKLLPAGAVLLTTRAPVGYVAIARRALATNQGFRSLVPKPGFTSEFLYYLLLSHTDYLRRHAGGTTFQELAGSTLKTLTFRVPPEKTQRRIAAILGALDDKIELNRRMNETLEAMAKAIFKSWFVDFDPVRRNIARKHGSADDPVLKRHSKSDAVFPDNFQDSPLGKIPEGWEVRPLDKVADYLNGLACQKYPPMGEESLPVIKIRELRQGITDNSDRVTPNFPKEYVIDDGDILFSWSGTLVVKIWCGGKGALNQHVFKVTSPTFPKWFYYHWTAHHLEAFRGIAADKATTMGHIKRRHLSEALVLVPEEELLGHMGALLSPLMERQTANSVEARTLAATRDTLLPKLLSGEIRLAAAKPRETTLRVAKTAARAKKKGKASEEFKEAILIAALVRELATEAFPLGRKRYNKFAYLVHRKAQHDVGAKYLKKAAGPYSPWARYQGPETIALDKKYIRPHRKGRYKGFCAGDNTAKIDRYLRRYRFADPLRWGVETFRYADNDELELLTTVDFAGLELAEQDRPITTDSIRQVMGEHPEWSAKLDRETFSDANIQCAIDELSRHFPETYGG